MISTETEKLSINDELLNLNIDILAKGLLKKSTINKLHKLKIKKIGDMANTEYETLRTIVEEDSCVEFNQFLELLGFGIVEFMQRIFISIKNDQLYEMVLLHVKNHTHQEIAQTYGTSKEKMKLNFGKFFQSLFTLADTVGDKLIENKPYLGIEELEEITATEDDYMLLLAVLKTHETKWAYHYEAECFTRK